MTGIAALTLGIAIWAADRLLWRMDVAGIRYPEQVMAYRTQAVEPRWQRPDGSLELDGVLFRHRPQLDLDLGRHRLRTNALGLRGPEISVTKPVDTYRVLVLGDSVVYGWGVEDEHTFVRQLEKRWNERADGVRYEVLNAGHLVYDTVQQAALLREEGWLLQPDLVLLVYVINDVEPTRDLVEDFLGLERAPDPANALAQPESSGVFRTLRRIEGYLPAIAALGKLVAGRTLRYDALLAQHGGSYHAEELGAGIRGWERSRAALLEIQAACAKRGVPFVLLDHSFPPIRALPTFAAEHGIDLAPFVFTREEQALPIRNSPVDSHANPRGHSILLRKLELALEARGFPPPR